MSVISSAAPSPRSSSAHPASRSSRRCSTGCTGSTSSTSSIRSRPGTIAAYVPAIGIKSRVRPMERAAFFAAWREKKLHGLLIGATGAAGNAAARLEPFFTKGGIYAYGSHPEIDDLFQRQAKMVDRKQREVALHQIQRIVTDQVLVAPIFQQGFIWGVGPRVEVSGPGLIQGYTYAAPCEDLKLK